MGKRRAFWKELSDEAVEVLIRAALLRTIHVCEIHFALQHPLNRFVMTELEAIVESDGVYRKTSERDLDDVGYRVRIEGTDFPDDAEARCAINKREKCMARVILGPMDEITFPIANAAAFFDNERSLANVTLVRMPEIFAGSVGKSRTALEAQICLPALPATMHPVVYRLMAERSEVSGTPHVADNLLRRQGISQELLDIRLQFGDHCR